MLYKQYEETLHIKNLEPDINWKLESSNGNWIIGGIGSNLTGGEFHFFRGISAIRMICSECVSVVKIKTVSLKSNIFFKVFQFLAVQSPFPATTLPCKPLLSNGFKLFIRGLECFFFFPVEPPFRRRFLHQGIDMPHPYQVPDAFQFAAEG